MKSLGSCSESGTQCWDHKIERSVGGLELTYTEASAKRENKKRIENNFNGNNSSAMWQGVKNITDYKQSNSHPTSIDPYLPEQPNTFFIHFDKRSSLNRRTDWDADISFTENDQSLPLQNYQVKRAIYRIDFNKATGQVMKAYAEQLTVVFTHIFNLSLQQATVPICLKPATIIPIHKISAITNMNDYQPIALTLLIMKWFDRLALSHIKPFIPPDLDKCQFA